MPQPRVPPRVSLAHISFVCAVATVALGASTLAHALPQLALQLPLAVILTIPFAAGAFAIGGVSLSGALAGAAVSMALFAGSGWAGWLLLVGVFAMTTGTTRLGRARKTAAGIAELRHGRRAVGNVIANTGVAATAALFMHATAGSSAGIAVAAALITAASDSVASEIGKAYGTKTYLVPSGQLVPPGTNGAVSAIGTAAGACAALALAGISAWSGLIPAQLLAVVAAAAVVASFVEGAIGTALEDPGWLDNDGVNFLNTLMGVALAVAASRLLALA